MTMADHDGMADDARRDDADSRDRQPGGVSNLLGDTVGTPSDDLFLPGWGNAEGDLPDAPDAPDGPDASGR